MQGFDGCKWCGGQGCNQCLIERRKLEAEIEAAQLNPQPIFTADINNSDDMELLKDNFGAEALARAFGPGGGGMEEIETNAAVASLVQTLRNH